MGRELYDYLFSLDKLAYQDACCHCEYYINDVCTNKTGCFWTDLKKALTDYQKFEELVKTKCVVSFAKDNPSDDFGETRFTTSTGYRTHVSDEEYKYLEEKFTNE